MHGREYDRPMLSTPQPIPGVLARPSGLLEGPTELGGGSIAFSDVIAGGIYRLDAGGGLTELLAKRRGIGGLARHRNGGLVATGRSLIHVDAGSGATREVLEIDDSAGFNDLAAAPGGVLIAGVLRYRPLAGEPERPGLVVRVATAGEYEVIADDVMWPNGIAVDGGRGRIYVADFARRRVLVYALGETGIAGEPFCASPQGSADGVALDAEGGLWVALGDGGGIARFTSGGELDRVLDVPARFVSSLCFAGPELRSVYVTTADNLTEPENGGCVFVAESELPGMPVFECDT